MTPAVFAQLDRLERACTDKLYIHIDMDVLDPREVDGHGNKVPERAVERGAGGAVRADLRALSESVGHRLRDDSADRSGGLSIAALNRMIVGAVNGVRKRGAK